MFNTEPNLQIGCYGVFVYPSFGDKAFFWKIWRTPYYSPTSGYANTEEGALTAAREFIKEERERTMYDYGIDWGYQPPIVTQPGRYS